MKPFGPIATRAQAWRRKFDSLPRDNPLHMAGEAMLRWSHDGGPQLGAAIAFYTMFAVAPLLVVAIAIAGAVLGADAARGHIVGQIEGLVGPSAARGIEEMIASAWQSPHGLLAGTLGVITLLVGASGVFAQLRKALNAIGHVAPLPSLFSGMVRARLVAFALVLGFGFLAIASLLVSAVMAALGAYLATRYEGLAELFALLDVAISTGVLVVAFAALLRWLPDVPPSRRAMWIGAICSALLFAIGKHLIGMYLARASIASSYGAAGSFVVVMLWVYYSAQILLFGAALAATVDQAGNGHPGRPSAAEGEPPRNTAAPPTSLAAVRSRLRPASAATLARRRPVALQEAHSAVLLRFPPAGRREPLS